MRKKAPDDSLPQTISLERYFAILCPMPRNRKALDSIDGLKLHTSKGQLTLAKSTAQDVLAIAESARWLTAFVALQAGLLALLLWRTW